MANIDKIIKSKYQPKQTNVAWVDLSGETPVEKHFINGRWVATSSEGSGGTTDYSRLNNKPSINGVSLNGNKTAEQLNIVSYDNQSATDIQRNKALANVSNQTANSTTGKMGYKVLDPTKTFASQVTAENTIYEIRDVFDLGGTQETPVSVTLPEGCTLKFNGGKLKNCILSGDKTFIDSNSVTTILESVSLIGTYTNQQFDVRYFGIKPNDNTIDCTPVLNNVKGCKLPLYFTTGRYYFSPFYFENTNNDKFTIIGDEDSGLGYPTTFMPFTNNQSYIIKIGGGANTLGGTGRGYKVSIINISFVTPNTYSPVNLTNNYNGTSDWCHAALILDRVQIGKFSIAGSGIFNTPLLLIGYIYECYFNKIICHGNYGTSQLPLIAIVNDTSHPYSAITINQIQPESIVGPLLYSSTSSSGSEMIITNLLYEASLNTNYCVQNEMTYSGMLTDEQYSTYQLVPIFDLSGFIGINITQCSCTRNNITWQNKFDEDTPTSARIFARSNFCGGYVRVVNMLALEYLYISGNSAIAYNGFVNVINWDENNIKSNGSFVCLTKPKSNAYAIELNKIYRGRDMWNVIQRKKVGDYLVPFFYQNNDVASLQLRLVANGYIIQETAIDSSVEYFKLESNKLGSTNTKINILYYDENDTLLSTQNISYESVANKNTKNIVKLDKPQGYKYLSIQYPTINGYNAFVYEFAFYDADNAPFSHRGNTSSRPGVSIVPVGFQYFDTTLGKFICSNGTAWVNLDGTALS